MPLPRPQDIEKLNAAVDAFAIEMKKKLAFKAQSGWRGWNHSSFRQIIEEKLLDHVGRVLIRNDTKQTVDIANLAMMLWWQQESRKRKR